MAAIQEMQQHYGVTGMVGGGINDAPALAQADMGASLLVVANGLRLFNYKPAGRT